ncbi:hypothetical protein P153DRAFT_368765 [Dothidotthia symphoricarpi CBS 119687]|uniref:Uncharacterized protein n=1 Tax=Dothidotthia symphoricarpi CBS 119687 TaxID=1392245 RepID=A0A6A6A576_9PLEO|nr:uncharacterized protein P153DRAFT_368765 [Dothidotthia symphoricarpi CBS 119687]KAF2126696.1 hypothetical protein P153DRAFT_368765 [Dothidotthia symphoricarpi CBS 119687]
MARTSLIKKQNAASSSSSQQAEKNVSEQQPRPVMRDYPGLGLPLRHNDQRNYGFYPIGAHGSNYAADTKPLFVREVAMMSVMEQLTEKEDWHKKVFDDKIVAKWREEALAIPNYELWKLATSAKRMYRNNVTEMFQFQNDSDVEPLEGIMTEKTFDCCIEELRSKAAFLEKTGIIPTLDACASVAKSDTLVSPELHDALRDAFETIKASHASSPDWHPNSQDMVQDLVHPSMFPLVYGRTRVLKDEVVGVADAIEKWAGKGDVIAKDTSTLNPRDRVRYGVGSGEVPPDYWSNTYQWLPANVAFQEDNSVKFTSYVNNLHPTKYPGIYRTIEKLIETSLPMWDQCLALAVKYSGREGAGRLAPRFPEPANADDENDDNWTPNNAAECNDVEFDAEEFMAEEGYERDDLTEDVVLRAKWHSVRKAAMPEPPFTEVDYAPKAGKRLIDRYRESGLQIIVKMASIELTPEKPEFPVGGWHVEGQMNEHICATALYYLDSENITGSNLSFRMQTSAYLNDDAPFNVGQDAYHWMESVFGTSFGNGNSPCLQNYGSVETREGRLLAFPNVFQHRVSPFKLIDPTKPGHRRFIALWLVDPNKRIISTANVPPQQMDWWADSVLGSTPESRAEAMSKLPPELVALLEQKGLDASRPEADGENPRLPQELMDMVREHFDADADTLPMSMQEAREHRAKLMQERSAFHDTAEKGWQQHTYSFCEH